MREPKKIQFLPLILVLFLLTMMIVPITSMANTPINLGTSSDFAVLAGSNVSDAGVSSVGGNIGVSPGSAITGFPPGILTGTKYSNDSVAIQAQTDLTNAYEYIAKLSYDYIVTDPDLGGYTLTPGVYKTGATASLGITGILTLDGIGNPNATFIFQIESTLTTAAGAGASEVRLINVDPSNVYWQVGSSVTLGTYSVFKGNILAMVSITTNTGATVDGRLLARNQLKHFTALSRYFLSLVNS